MRSTILFLLSILLSLPFLAEPKTHVEAPTWTHVSSFPNAPSGRYDDMTFLTAEKGWVVNLAGEIWRTGNAGESWTKQNDNSSTPFRSVTFRPIPNSRGLDVGWAGTLHTASSVLWETHDGGDHWVDITHRISGIVPQGLCGMVAVGNSAWGVGAFNGNPTLIQTHDGGISWVGQDMRGLAGALVDVHFINEQVGIATGGSGGSLDGEAVVLRTNDGGATWEKVFQSTRSASINGEWGWKISFPTDLVGYISVETINNPGLEDAKVLKTVDGGVTWEEIRIDGSVSGAGLQGIGFISPDVGWASGRGVTSVTVDGGDTWQQLNHFNPQTGDGQMDGRMNRFYMVNDTLAFGVGRRLYKISGFGAITVNSEVAQQPESFSIEPSYPNPFSASTTLRYTLREPSGVEVRVVDMLGRVHTVSSSRFQDVGTHEIVWDGTDESGVRLPSGNYIFLVDIGESIETKQVVFLRD